MQEIYDNVNRIREEIAAAEVRAGRPAGSVQLLAATKMNDTRRVRAAVEAGVDLCGENRVQELQQKQAENAYEGVPVHFIGHLQRNKAKFLVGHVDMIQSVDSVALLEILDRLARERQVHQDILLEINIGGEAAKSGIPPEMADEMSAKMEEYPNLLLRGFMTIPPISEKSGANLNFFAKMYQLYVDIRGKKYDNTKVDCLSMGMSDDFADAIAQGATLVRVGSRIFGERHY